MRIQISVPDDLIPILDQLAIEEHRDPRRQAEWLLRKALEHAAQSAEGDPSCHEKQIQEVADAPAHVG